MANSSDSSTGQALEQAILDNPDDLGAYGVYADWLQEQGDPRGEFIAVQLILEDEERPAEERKHLQERERELLQTHQEEWLGGLAPYVVHQKGLHEYYAQNDAYRHRCQFRRGLPFGIRIFDLSANMAYHLANTPALRFVQQLSLLNGLPWEDNDEQPPGAAEVPADENPIYFFLKQAPFLPTLRVFQLGEDYEDDQYGGSNCHANGDRVVELIRLMPRLEELRLMAHQLAVDAILQLSNLTKLRLLEIDHAHNYPLNHLAENSAFQNLTHLRLHPHALEYGDGPYIRLEHIQAIVRSPYLQKVEHLRLCLTDAGDEGVREIVDSGALKRLKVLDLSHGCITDDGANVLASSPDVKNLQYLDLNYNMLTNAGVQILQSLGIAFSANEQFDPATMEEQEFLFGGDIE